jgi:AcrR family transcriptional regulator
MKTSKTIPPRQSILETAVRLFSDRGYNGTTMRDIAQEVGMLAGSLYAHIDSKETLLLEIVQTGIERFLAIERELAASEAPPVDRLRAAIVAHMGVVAEDPQRTLVVFHQWRFLTDPNREQAIAMRRRYAQAFIKIVDDGVASGDFNASLDTRITVFAILGALNWAPEWYSGSGPLQAQEIGNKLADSLIGGLIRCVDGKTPVAAAQKKVRPAPAASARKKKADPRVTPLDG